MLRIAVCDNNPNIANQIKNAVNMHCIKNNREYIVKYFESANKLLAAPFDYSILFLGTALDNNINGIELGKRLRIMRNSALFVLMATGLDWAEDGYEATVFRYIIKPLVKTRIFDILDAALDYWGYSTDIMAVSFKYHTNYIPIKDIIVKRLKNKRTKRCQKKHGIQEYFSTSV